MTERPIRRAAKEVAVAEVTVLGDHDAVFCVSNPTDLRVGGAVLVGRIECVERVVPRLVQMSCEPSWELCIDEELHAAPRGDRRMPAVLAPNSSAASRSSRSRSG